MRCRVLSWSLAARRRSQPRGRGAFASRSTRGSRPVGRGTCSACRDARPRLRLREAMRPSRSGEAGSGAHRHPGPVCPKGMRLPRRTSDPRPRAGRFAASSLFEARLARDLFPDSPIHLTTPGLRDDEVDELAEVCSALAFNSASQLHRWGARVYRYASVGIRVNTLVSNISDHRYDPARPESKLGIPLAELPEVLASSPVPIHGLHFHTNADSDDLRELETNVEALADSARGVGRFKWVNFGGGYLFGNVSTLEPLERCVELAKRVLADEVFVEPGAGLVRDAGRLVASVIDVFERDGNRVAILDTSVNHARSARVRLPARS